MPLLKKKAKPVGKNPAAGKSSTGKNSSKSAANKQKPAEKASKKTVAAPAKSKAAPKKIETVKRANVSTPTQGFIATKQIVELAKGYKPTEKEEYMNKNQLEYFRRKLLEWKSELLDESRETLDHLREENWNEPDLNDRATVETEAALELRTRDRYRKLIAKIDSALRRIESGDYGYCEETGDPIGVKRLEARPTATLTIQAQERHERHEKMYNDDDWKE